MRVLVCLICVSVCNLLRVKVKSSCDVEDEKQKRENGFF